MSFLNTVLKKRHIVAGQAGFIKVSGSAAFSTTDTSGTITIGLQSVEHVTITPAQASFIANDLCSWTFSAGVLTITRVAGTTSGLKITFSAEGL